jgi:tetratricopeptide (TPR) repeat protein
MKTRSVMRASTKQNVKSSHLTLMPGILLLSAALSGCAGQSYEERMEVFEEQLRLRSEQDYRESERRNRGLRNDGVLQVELGNYREAISSFNEIIHWEREFSGVSLHTLCPTYLNRGYCHFQLKLYDRAIDDFNQVINGHVCYASALDEKAQAYLNRAMTYARKRQYENAIADINEGLKIDPTNSKLLDARSTIQTLALRSGLYDD